jgi:polysaccharide chain length determinant protein (PEP-CTERM system associated)
MEELIAQLFSTLGRIWKYRWYALGIMWLVATIGWARVITLPDDYQSSARVFVDTQSILKPLLSGMTSIPNVEQQVGIMSRTLLSRPNIERVMRMVDLDIDAATPREHEARLDELLKKLKISGTSTYDIYTITYNNSNPRLVRDVVQSLLTIFVEGSFKGKKTDSEKAVQFIEEQIRSYEDKLAAAENRVKEFKLKNSLLLPRPGTDYSGQLLLAADTLGAAKLELLEAEEARNAIKRQADGDEPALVAEPAPAGGADESEIGQRIAALNRNLDTLLLQYTEQHPDVVAARRLLGLLEARRQEQMQASKASADPGKHYSPMLQQLKMALAEADAKVAAVQARVRELEARSARLWEQSKAVPELETQLTQLNRDYQVNKENYEKLIGRREAARLSGDLNTNTDMITFRIIDPPTMPLAPTGPNRPLLLSIVMAVAVVAGAGLALLISQVRPTFLSPAELRAATAMPVLGSVSMSWTQPQRQRRRRGRYALGTAAGSLFLLYGGVMAASLVR